MSTLGKKLPSSKKNEIGNRYNRLLVISFFDITKGRQARWLCRCDCGNERIVVGSDLRRGDHQSCGCLANEIHSNILSIYNKNNIKLGKENHSYKHGLSKSKEYSCQASSKRRALIKNQSPILTELEKKKVMLYYQIASYLGEGWHVDHIQPISKGGIHHPDNLQIITKTDNIKKKDKLDYIPSYSFRIDNLKEL